MKDIGKAMVFSAKPPFDVLKVIDIGPIANHVNLVNTPRDKFAYITVGGLNQVKVFRTSDFESTGVLSLALVPFIELLPLP